MSDISPRRTSVKIIKGALDVTDDGERMVLRGVVDPDSLHLIKVPEYQREVLSDKKIAALKTALRNGTVPDIDLGVRGDSLLAQNGAYYLQDPTYVIDGLQRMTAAGLLLMDPLKPFRAHLGAMVNFNTDEAWERTRFEALNLGQTKLSPNVTLANQRHENIAAAELYNLARSPAFCMGGKISWTQGLRKGELITATTYFQTVGHLMGHISAGRAKQVIHLSAALERMMLVVGKPHFTRNIVRFFDAVSDAWGVHNVAFREGAVHLRAGFLRALAMFFSEHQNYWRGTEFVVDALTIGRLKSFPVQDPTVAGLASGSSINTNTLVHLLIKHVGDGRRAPRLVPRTKTGEGAV